ncbi:MAG: HD domain-containing protein, partial [bacterium]|nr:HD domain-containing protein [bacterium]
TLRKIYTTFSENPRVILLKLADRLHNTRTIDGFKDANKRRRRSQETLDYYAPLATRLGIWSMKAELEDTSLKHVDPDGYEKTREELERERANRHDNIASTAKKLEDSIRAAGLEAEIVIKPKHLYSVYRKKQRTGRDINQIYDIDAININVPTVSDCYTVLGVVHSVFIPQPDKMSDYLANPKTNNYRAFHTTVKGVGNQFVEVQITNTAQARVNEWGVLAKYYYSDSAQHITEDPSELIKELQSWISAITECNELADNDQDFIDIMCSDGMATTISVFTPPNGEVKNLKEDSVAIDAAYKVHTRMGDTASGVLINKEPSSLDRKLRSGDFVEIFTKKEEDLSPEELEEKFNERRALYYKSATRAAKTGITKWLAKQDRKLNIEAGKAELCRTLISLNIASLQHNEDFVRRVAARCGMPDAENLYFALGCLSVKQAKLKEVIEQEQVKVTVPKAKSLAKQKKHARMQQAGTVVLASNMEARVFYGGCCSPLPGDPIKGFRTKTNDVVRVHSADCPELKKHLEANPDRYVEVKWDNNAVGSIFKAPAGFRMKGRLRPRLTSDVIDVFDTERAPILHFEFDNVNEDSETQFKITFLAPSAEYVAEKQKALENISDITSVVRLDKV